MVRSHYDPPDQKSTDEHSAFVFVLRTAVDAGELDTRIEVVSGLVKAGVDKEATSSKRPILKLPAKTK